MAEAPDSKDHYYSTREITRKLSISPTTLGLITSNLIVDFPSIASTIPIGLFLKSSKQKLVLPGYVKYGRFGWLYSEKAYQAIKEYMVISSI
jgi:hypothetical protein